MTRHILLRDSSDTWLRSASGAHPAARRRGPARPDLEIADLTARDLRDVARETRVLAFAPVMPTRMVSPMPLDDPRPEDAMPGWGPKTVGIAAAKGGAPVALLDTGIDAAHPAFDALSIEGRDFTGSGLDDVNGHGTHLAATIAGRPCEGQRVGCLEAQARLIVGKVLADTGTGTTADLFGALLWAAECGAGVFGTALTLDSDGLFGQLAASGQPSALAHAAARHATQCSLELLAVLLRMLAHRHKASGGVLLIVAAGNDSRRMVSSEFEAGCHDLAALDDVLAVGAVGQEQDGLTIAPFSNTGPDLVAPGVGIVSARPGGGLRALNGTSVAMAHALAAASLWRDRTPDAEATRIALLRSASHQGLPPTAIPYDAGAGLVQAPAPALPGL